MWARVHKIDRIKPQPGGGAIVLVHDERNPASMSRVAPLSTLIALARILNARRALDAKYGGKGEIRYAAAALPPPFLTDAIIRAGAIICDSTGDRIVVPAQPAAISSIVDNAFADLAHHVRTNIGAKDMVTALRITETARRKSPLDRDAAPEKYWPAVFELAALAGEMARPRGGRWVESDDMPVPFVVKFPKGEVAMPAKLAQKIVDGTEATGSLESA